MDLGEGDVVELDFTIFVFWDVLASWFKCRWPMHEITTINTFPRGLTGRGNQLLNSLKWFLDLWEHPRDDVGYSTTTLSIPHLG
jgi:hypothetical protein